MTRAAAIAGVVAIAACGGDGGAPGSPTATLPSPVPARAATAGEPLLALLPAGADVLVEIDLARLRGNAVVGALAAEALGGAPGLGLPGGGEAPPLTDADAVVLASYDVGTAQAATVTLVTGGEAAAAALPGAARIADGVVALASPELLARLGAGGATLADDDELRALRARAMPARADGAVVRVTARLSFDARIALASQLGIDAAPAALSVWGDVADDLAVIALVDGPDAGGGAVGDEVGAAMADGARAWLAELARRPELAVLGLAPVVRAAEVTPRGEGIRIVALVGPRRLARAVTRARALLEASP